MTPRTILAAYAAISALIGTWLMRDTIASPEAAGNMKHGLMLDAFWAVLWPVVGPFVAVVYWRCGRMEGVK